MPTRSHVHSVMLSIIRASGSQCIEREELVSGAMKFDAYKDRFKADKFIARQVFRLKKLGLLTAHGPKNDRWYGVSDELLDTISESGMNAPSVLKELSGEEAKIESAISLHLAELEEMKALLKQYPMLSEKADEQVSFERESLTRLYGRLSAVRKLKVAAESLEAS